MQIVFVLVDLSDMDVATPVLDFFALDSTKTRVMVLLWFILFCVFVLHFYNVPE